MAQAEAPRVAIRNWRASHQRSLVVLDDDPTGSQSVHGIQVVTIPDEREIEAALDRTGTSAFVLTNTRGLPEGEAVALTRRLVAAVMAIDPEADIVSRSDSTLRGHVIAEVQAIEETRASITGRHYDGVLLAPAFFEAGRFTRGNFHYATIGGDAVLAGETEFARDRTFGYASSDLRDFVAEKSGGRIHPGRVLSISLDTIAEGAEAVADVLVTATDLAYIVVNGVSFEDFETVVLGVQLAVDAGKSFLFRTGPSFVRAVVGLDPIAPLGPEDFPSLASRNDHGLVVVGSHVSQTSRQVDAARELGDLTEFELDVDRVLLDDKSCVAELIGTVRAALAESDVLLYTSRSLVAGTTAASSLEIAQIVSTAVSAVVAGVLDERPAWVIAKGGITSHDVAVHGLGMRRARVLGQLLPGMVSVFEPVAAAPNALGMPYVVFAGNVGDDQTLREVIEVLRAAAARTKALA